MNGLPPHNHHPMYDRNGHHLPPSAAAHGYADALLNSRYPPQGHSASAGMDPLLLQQELRRQDLLASGHGYGGPSMASEAQQHLHQHQQHQHQQAMLARREEELAHLHDAHNRIMEAELAARAMRDRIAAQSQSQHPGSSSSHHNAHQHHHNHNPHHHNPHHHQAVQVHRPGPNDIESSLRSESIERMLALQEHQAMRQREIEKLKQAELAEHANAAAGRSPLEGILPGRSPFGGVGSGSVSSMLHHPAAAPPSSSSAAAAAAQLSSPTMAMTERERYLEAAYAARGLLPPSSAASLGQGASAIGSNALHPVHHHHQVAQGLPPALREEMALQERMRFQRRMIEEEAVKQEVMKQEALKRQAVVNSSHQASHQAAMMGLSRGSGGGGGPTPTTTATAAESSSGSSAAVSDREHLTRLLQLQQMSDEDLIRRAAEVQSAQSAALRDSIERNKSAALEQQILEAQLLRSGLQGSLASRFQNQGGLGSSQGSGLGGMPRGLANLNGNGDRRLDHLDMIDQAHADDLVSRRMSMGTVTTTESSSKPSMPLPPVVRKSSPTEVHVPRQSKLAQQLKIAQQEQQQQQELLLRQQLDASRHSQQEQQEMLLRQQQHLEAARLVPTSTRHSSSTSSPTMTENSIQQNTNGQPLRYFNNGIEVDMEGNPLHNAEHSPSAALVQAMQSQQHPSMHLQQQLNSSAGSNANTPSPVDRFSSLDNNIIAKFLTVVVSRVPEIAPAVADLLPDGGDPMLLKQEFPNVVDATLSELKSIQERFSKSAAEDENVADLHKRVTNCIAAIEPYKVDLSTAGGLVPLPAAPSGSNSNNLMGSVLGSMMMPRGPPPEPSLDPNSCQPLMPNKNNPGGKFAASSSPSGDESVVSGGATSPGAADADADAPATTSSRPTYFTPEEQQLGEARRQGQAQVTPEDRLEVAKTMQAHAQQLQVSALEKTKAAQGQVQQASSALEEAQAQQENTLIKPTEPEEESQQQPVAVVATSLVKKIETKPKSKPNTPMEESLPMMATYKCKKSDTTKGDTTTPKPTKKSTKKKKSVKDNTIKPTTTAKAKKQIKMKTPKLVHHALFKGSIDMNNLRPSAKQTASPSKHAIASSELIAAAAACGKSSSTTNEELKLPPTSESIAARGRAIAAESGSIAARGRAIAAEAKKKCRAPVAPSAVPKSSSPSKNNRPKTKPRPTKKRRISHPPEDAAVLPANNIYQKNGRVMTTKKNTTTTIHNNNNMSSGPSNNNRGGPHGAVLNQIFASNNNKQFSAATVVKEELKTTSAAQEEEDARKPNAEDATNSSVITEESEDQIASDAAMASQMNRSNDRHHDDGQFDAANVLLGLMGK